MMNREHDEENKSYFQIIKSSECEFSFWNDRGEFAYTLFHRIFVFKFLRVLI